MAPARGMAAVHRKTTAHANQPLLPQLFAGPEACGGGRPELETVLRRGPVLRPSPLADLVGDEVCSLNLTAGCPLRCPWSPSRVYPNYPGDESVILYGQTAERLEAELAVRRRLPRAVHLCPANDPFPPYPAIQQEVGRVLEVLARAGVEGWFLTRGYPGPTLLDQLARFKDLVRVTVAIDTVNPNLRKALEPMAAPARLRLKLIRQLRRLGIPVQVSVEPLLPGLTDTVANLEPLLTALAETGIQKLSAGYLCLRPGMREVVARHLAPHGWDGPVLAAYAGGTILPLGRGQPALHLPQPLRQNGYARLVALAARKGMTASVCGLTNPDFKPPRLPAAQRRVVRPRALEVR